MGGVEVDIFVADAHASVRKAAALAGLGRRSVVQVGDAAAEREGRLVSMDLVELERRLRENEERGRGSIVVTSFGEVNTGCVPLSLDPRLVPADARPPSHPRSAINADTPAVRALCDRYGAWLHIDAAFAAFAVLHPDFAPYRAHLALADSLTTDAHKWLNVPYDCGIYLSRSRRVDDDADDEQELGVTASLYDLCGPGDSAPAYLATPAAAKDSASSSHPRVEASKALKSPLFHNVENSRRLCIVVSLSLASPPHGRPWLTLSPPSSRSQPRPPPLRLAPLARPRRLRPPRRAQRRLCPPRRGVPAHAPRLRRPHARTVHRRLARRRPVRLPRPQHRPVCAVVARARAVPRRDDGEPRPGGDVPRRHQRVERGLLHGHDLEGEEGGAARRVELADGARRGEGVGGRAQSARAGRERVDGSVQLQGLFLGASFGELAVGRGGRGALLRVECASAASGSSRASRRSRRGGRSHPLARSAW